MSSVTKPINATPVVDRDSARAKIFASKNFDRKRKTIEFNGVQLDLVQPTVEETLTLRDGREDSSFAVMVLIKYTRLHGTDTPVFDDSDYEQLLAMPYSKAFTDVVMGLEELSNIEIKDKAKNSGMTPSAGT